MYFALVGRYCLSPDIKTITMTAIFNDENGACIFIQTDLKTIGGYIKRAKNSRGEFLRVKSVDFYLGDNRPYYNQNSLPYKTVLL